MDFTDKIKTRLHGCINKEVVTRQGMSKWMGQPSGLPENNPFQSESQRRFMYAKHPKIAKRWSAHTPKGKSLPEKKG